MPESKAESMPEDSHRITGLLLEWRAGKTDALNQLMDLVYGELHEMAARQMRREHAGHILQTTAVLHEVYLRMCGAGTIDWQDRAHFFALAAQQLRRVLVDHARRVRSEKRGGAQIKFSLSDLDCEILQLDEGLLALDEALGRLHALDERAAKVVEFRFFGGLGENEVAEALNISIATVKRDWDFARAWLASQLM